jgi:uncharacterized protein HemY
LLGRLYERTGDLAAAEQAFERARHAAERASNQRNVTGAANSLGDVGAARGDLSGAAEACKAGLRRCVILREPRRSGRSDPDTFSRDYLVRRFNRK